MANDTTDVAMTTTVVLDRMLPPEVRITTAVVVTIISIIAIVGNTMTIIAHTRDTKLHTVYNFFIFHLAITDLLIGVWSMPIYTVYSLLGYWPLGNIACKIWLLVDFVVLMETTLLMIVLSLDRLLLITLNLQYSSKITIKLARIQVAGSWILSALFFAPTILFWDYFVGYSSVTAQQCHVEFAYGFIYTLIVEIGELLIPLTCIVVINVLLYIKVKRRLQSVNRVDKTQEYLTKVLSKKKRKSKTKDQVQLKSYNKRNMDRQNDCNENVPTCINTSCSTDQISNGPCKKHDKCYNIDATSTIMEDNTQTVTVIADPLSDLDIEFSDIPSDIHSIWNKPDALVNMITEFEQVNQIMNEHNLENTSTVLESGSSQKAILDLIKSKEYYAPERHMNSMVNKSSDSQTKISKPCATKGLISNSKLDIARVHLSVLKLKKSLNKRRADRHTKAARFLFFLVLAFLIFWGPYCFLTLIVSLCKSCVDPIIYEFFYWWVWVKSALNPFIYASQSKQYMVNFKKYLRCKL